MHPFRINISLFLATKNLEVKLARCSSNTELDLKVLMRGDLNEPNPSVGKQSDDVVFVGGLRHQHC